MTLPLRLARDTKIHVAGSSGMVGNAFVRYLQKAGFTNVISTTHQQLDLTNSAATDTFFHANKPQCVILAAAKVGGIAANDAFPADFIRINLEIQTNVIDACFRHGVKKLVFLGSSCIYPKLAPQPMKEECLLSGKLEPTNDAYALAKIAGIMMCKSYNRQYGTNFIAAMPTNLYGPGDNFCLQGGHVLPAMIRKFHEGKVAGKPSVELWGTGAARREFLYVDDLAEALAFLLENFDAPRDKEVEKMFVNVGVGEDISIKELAELVKETVGYKGGIHWNPAMPDGTPRKLLDVQRLTSMGWKARTPLKEGITLAYKWLLENLDQARK